MAARQHCIALLVMFLRGTLFSWKINVERQICL
jgi:hypothetical protein